MPSSRAYDAYIHNNRFQSLDGLRCLCIVAVLWHHSYLREGLDGILLSRGHVGVDFFFVLSGFLITTLLLREEDRTGAINLPAFYWRRALRILPVYWLVVAIAVLYEVVLKGNTGALELLPYYLLFFANFLSVPDIGFLAPTWSLSIEEQFYVVWPLLLIMLPSRCYGAALLGIIGGILVGASGILAIVGIHAIDAHPLRLHMPGAAYTPLALGALAAVTLHSRNGFAMLARFTYHRSAPAVLFLSIVVALAILPQKLGGWPNMVIHSLMTLALISLVVREDSGLASIARFRPFARVGQISYGVYLYHLFALAIVEKIREIAGLPQGWVAFLGYCALSIVIAEISFRTLERYFLEQRYRVRRMQTPAE